MSAPAASAPERSAAPGEAPLDRRGRPLRDLRLSVTDRCDFRCTYCMPEETYTWLPREDILSFEELEQVVRAFAGAGVTKVRLTGGEPLLRRDLPALVGRIVAVPGVEQVCLTTNGGRLATHAAALHAAGLHRVTVSLDTLRPERHAAITGRDTHAAVLAGLAALGEAGFTGTKVNAVIQRGVNDDELVALLDFAAAAEAEVRFIEYMDVGGATAWTSGRVVPAPEILDRLSGALGAITPAPTDPAAPARRYTTLTAGPSGSSRRPPSRSARPATAAGSPPTASGTAASTRPRARTSAPSCATDGRGSSPTSSPRPGGRAPTKARSTAPPSPTAARPSRSSCSDATRTSRCTPRAGDVEVTVQGFGPARDHLGTEALAVTVPAGATVADVLSVLQARGGGLVELLPRCAIAVGDEIVPTTHGLAEGDLVAVLPPVAGGA